MKLLCVLPGASYATLDLYNGIVPELERRGVEVQAYNLETRLETSKLWLEAEWRRRGKPQPKFNGADVVYGASKDVIERALRWKADGVLIFSGMFLAGDAFALLPRAGIRSAVLLSESPYDDELQARILPYVQLAWTNERWSVDRLRLTNPNVYYLPHAYNPAIHHPDASADDPEVPAHDVVMVGSMFAERYELLKQVDWTGIDLGLYGEWGGIPSRSKLRQYVRASVVNNAYAAVLYRKAKIGLNLYRESIGWGRGAPRISHAESLNPRAYELAACGTFQISSYRDEVEEVFGGSVPTFKTAAELEALIRDYLVRPVIRGVKAGEAQQAVQGHTFAERAGRILSDVERVWNVRGASTPRLEAVLA